MSHRSAPEPDDLPSRPGLRFECTQCGECCKTRGEYAYVYLNDRDVVQIARLLGLLPHEFRRRYTRVDEYGWTQLMMGSNCVFLEPETGRCVIYPVRPTQCRTFPFWRDLVHEGEWTQEARALCEGVGRGRLYQIDEVEPIMREMEREEDC